MTKVKKNYRNLVHGDVLAYKIANDDEILNGRYFIYIRYNPKEWKDYPIINKKTSYKHNQVFAVAITKDCNIPKIENILDNVDYLPLEEYYFETDTVEIVYGLKYKNLIPDEYGLFYCCLKYLTFDTKEDRELKSVFYIGNIPDYKPKNLFIEEIYHASLYDSAINSIENKLLDVYKEKIIKKSEYYNEEYLVYLKKKYYFKVIANQNKLRKSTLEIPMYCYGYGADIYDNEVALNVQKIFEIVYDDQLKYVDIMNDLWIQVFDYVFDDNDFFIAYMVLADQFLKRKRIDNNLKNLAISVIKDDLKYNWEGREDYKKRAYFANKLLCNLIDFEPNEDTDYIFKNKSSFNIPEFTIGTSLDRSILKIKYINRFNYNIETIPINDLKSFSYHYGWGAGLYESDMALDTKGDYQKFMRKGKKDNQSHQEIIEDLIYYYSDIIKDKYDGPIFWIILANEELKKGLLTKDIRDKALKSIKKDLPNWKTHEDYEERKKILNDLKEKIENYKFDK